MSDRFNVAVRVEINKLQPDGRGWTGERLTISEEVTIGAANWVEISDVLGKFHALAEKIKDDK